MEAQIKLGRMLGVQGSHRKLTGAALGRPKLHRHSGEKRTRMAENVVPRKSWYNAALPEKSIINLVCATLCPLCLYGCFCEQIHSPQRHIANRSSAVRI